MKNLIAFLLIICLFVCSGCSIMNPQSNADSLSFISNESETVNESLKVDASDSISQSDPSTAPKQTLPFVSGCIMGYSFSSLSDFYLFMKTQEQDLSKYKSPPVNDAGSFEVPDCSLKVELLKLEDLFPSVADDQYLEASAYFNSLDSYTYHLKHDDVFITIGTRDTLSSAVFLDKVTLHFEEQCIQLRTDDGVLVNLQIEVKEDLFVRILFPMDTAKWKETSQNPQIPELGLFMSENAQEVKTCVSSMLQNIINSQEKEK